MGRQGGAGGPSGKEIRVNGSQLHPSPKEKRAERGGHGPSIKQHYPSSPAVGQCREMTRAAFGESRWQYGGSQANTVVGSVVEELLWLNIPPSSKSWFPAVESNLQATPCLQSFMSRPSSRWRWQNSVHTHKENFAGPVLVMAGTRLQYYVKKKRTENDVIYVLVQ